MNHTKEKTARSKFTLARIQKQRELVDAGMNSMTQMLIASIGQCSLNVRDIPTTLSEATRLQSFMFTNPGVFTPQRHNYKKPRSDPETWQGIGSSHPVEALKLHDETVDGNFAICSELITPEDIACYGDGLVLGWVGARNTSSNFIVELALCQRTLPIGIKNALDGSLEGAMERVELANTVRQNTGGGASAFLLHRGGTTLNTPGKWEESVKRTIDTLEGIVMIDLAHGAEQAHDPLGEFGKTVEGQIRAMEHYIEIGESTGLWANGIILEASDAPSDTDPNMPHKIALDGVSHIAQQMRFNQSAILE